MISIRKYLHQRGEPKVSGPTSDRCEPGCRFSASLLDSINAFTLAGDACKALRGQVELVRDSLRPDWTPEQYGEAEVSVTRILNEYAASTRRAATNQAGEMQHIFAMLNQALIVLAEGRDQSVSRLSQIQQRLVQTSRIQDIVAMKASLTDTVEFVKEESVRAHTAASQELEGFQANVSEAREFLGNAACDFAGRPEAVARIVEELRNPAAAEALHMVAYSFDRLKAATKRYGPDVASELIFRLIRERVQPLVGAGDTYRWTASSLVAIFQRKVALDDLRKEVAALNRSPVVHRVSLGNRTAVLTIAPSHLVAEGSSGSAEKLIEQVDRFTGFALEEGNTQ
jgi:hypothetical protein